MAEKRSILCSSKFTLLINLNISPEETMNHFLLYSTKKFQSRTIAIIGQEESGKCKLHFMFLNVYLATLLNYTLGTGFETGKGTTQCTQGIMMACTQKLSPGNLVIVLDVEGCFSPKRETKDGDKTRGNVSFFFY